MKKLLLLLVLLFCSTVLIAKDIQVMTITTNPQFNKPQEIKSALKNEEGIKNINANIKSQEICIIFDKDKISSEIIISKFSALGYDVKIVSEPKKYIPQADAYSGATM